VVDRVLVLWGCGLGDETLLFRSMLVAAMMGLAAIYLCPSIEFVLEHVCCSATQATVYRWCDMPHEAETPLRHVGSHGSLDKSMSMKWES
jgi:hypothetical protein